MSQFGTDVTSADEVASHTTVKEGVVEAPALMEGLTDTFKRAGAMFTASKKGKNDKIVNDFRKRQLLIADAYAQGVGTSAMAKTKMRQNLMDTLDASPDSVAGEIMKAQAALGVFGAADIVEKGSREEQIRFAKQDALIASGFLDSDDDSEEGFQKAESDALNTAEAKRRYDTVMDTFNLKLKSHAITQAERTEIEGQRKDEADRFVRDTAPAELNGMKATFDRIIAASGTEAEKMEAIEQQFIAFQGQISATLGDMTSQMSGSMMGPFDQMKELYLKKASGAMTDAELKRDVENTLIYQKKQMVVDPKLARIAAAQDLFQFGPAAVQLETEAYKRLVDLGAFNSGDDSIETVSPYKAGRTEEAALTEYVKQIDSALASGDDKKMASAATNFNNYLDSIVDFENRVKRDPKSAMGIISVMSSPTFLKTIRENPNSFSNRDEAAGVLREHYDKEVWGMVEREFENNSIIFPYTDYTGADQSEVKDTSEVVTAIATNSGMMFVAADGGTREAKAKAKELNKTLKPIINETLQAFAHLEGSDDYAAQWEKAQEFILSSQGTPDTSDDLDIDDFLEDTIPENTDYVADPAGYSVNSSMNPLLNVSEGASKMLRHDAGEKMEKTLAGPYARLVKGFGGDVIINDALAKAGTTRERQTKGSRHFHGDALDLSTAGMSNAEKLKLFREAKKAGFSGFGFGNNILHVDTGPNRAWKYSNKYFGGVNVDDLINEAKR